jgi:MFS family permease
MIFLPDMVIQRLGYTPAEAGAAVGLLTAAFSFGNFLTSSLWGHLSDHHGRKGVMLFGLVSCAVFLSLFGLSNTMAVAVANRMAEGLVNSNIAVSKAYVSDMTQRSPKEHRQMALAYQAASFSLARAVSSAFIGMVYSLTPKHGWMQFTVGGGCALQLIVVILCPLRRTRCRHMYNCCDTGPESSRGSTIAPVCSVGCHMVARQSQGHCAPPVHGSVIDHKHHRRPSVSDRAH